MTDDDRFDNPFCNELAGFLSEYEARLSSKGLTKNTINKHGHLVSAFLWFLDGYTNVQGFEDFSKATLNSRFRAELRNTDPGKFSDSFVRHALKGFFSFIHEAHGISTPLLRKEFDLPWKSPTGSGCAATTSYAYSGFVSGRLAKTKTPSSLAWRSLSLCGLQTRTCVYFNLSSC